MPHIPLLKPEQASREVNAVYDEFYRRMSFPSPPNFIMTQGHSVTVARGTWEAVRNVLVSGEIPRWTKEMIFVAISKDRQCQYCTAAHIACCRMLGVNPKTLDQLVNDVGGLQDHKLRDMILFALKCSRNPQSLTHDDYETLRRHGLKESDIVEIIGMAAFAVYANIVADATAMEPDDMFDSVSRRQLSPRRLLHRNHADSVHIGRLVRFDRYAVAQIGLRCGIGHTEQLYPRPDDINRGRSESRRHRSFAPAPRRGP